MFVKGPRVVILKYIHHINQEVSYSRYIYLLYISPTKLHLSHQNINSPGHGLWPVQLQAITWTNAGLISIGLQETYFSKIWIGIVSISFKKMQLKMSAAKVVAILSKGRWVDIIQHNRKTVHSWVGTTLLRLCFTIRVVVAVWPDKPTRIQILCFVSLNLQSRTQIYMFGTKPSSEPVIVYC